MVKKITKKIIKEKKSEKKTGKRINKDAILIKSFLDKKYDQLILQKNSISVNKKLIIGKKQI